eukprot:430944-Hanusia_phi.AAC.1
MIGKSRTDRTPGAGRAPDRRGGSERSRTPPAGTGAAGRAVRSVPGGGHGAESDSAASGPARRAAPSSLSDPAVTAVTGRGRDGTVPAPGAGPVSLNSS